MLTGTGKLGDRFLEMESLGHKQAITQEPSLLLGEKDVLDLVLVSNIFFCDFLILFTMFKNVLFL